MFRFWGCGVTVFIDWGVPIESWQLFSIYTLSPLGIGAVGLLSEGKAPIPYGSEYLQTRPDEILIMGGG